MGVALSGNSEQSLASGEQSLSLPTEGNEIFPGSRHLWWVAGLVIVAVLVRLIFLGYPDLIDPSESRFATSAQQMVASGNYITPMIHSAEGWRPYWAKPPLHLWLTAASLRTFGTTTAAARLPGFFSVVLCSLIAAALGAVLISRSVGLLSALVYLSFTGVFLGSAVSLTDPTLALCVSAAYGATFFAIFREESGPRRVWWFRLAFAALGLGFLVKGPVAVVLFAVGVGLWLLGSRRWSLVLEVPWRSGLAIWVGCWMPWYIAAEIATPGFLRYFFLQENLLRFVSSSESGLRYGTLHTHTRGMIWVMLCGVAFPWSLIAVGRLWGRERAQGAFETVRRDSRVLFLVCWGVSAPLFFTAARQVLPTYTYAGLPPLAILMAMGLAAVIDSRGARHLQSPGVARVAGLLGTICLLGGMCGIFQRFLSNGGSIRVSLFAVILGVFVVCAANRYRHSSAAVLVPLAIFALIAAYSGVIAGVAGWVSERRSTAAILAAARFDDDQRQMVKPIAVLFSAPHSILFYGTGLHDGNADGSELPVISMGGDLTQAITAGAKRFIIKEADIKRLSAEERSRLIQQATRGQWHLFGLAAG